MPTEQARPSFYLLPPERYLPASALSTWLGRIVKSYSEPDANFVPDDPKPFVTHEFARSTIANASLDALSKRNTSFAAKLGATVDVSRETSNGGGLSFTSSEVVCVRLQNYDQVFDRLIQHEETRSQLQRMLARGGNAGFHGYCGSHLAGCNVHALKRAWGHNLGRCFGACVYDWVSGSRSRQDTAEFSGESAGSNIFALQYKTVRRSVFQSFLGMNNGMMLKVKGPDLPASQSFAKKHRGDDESESGESDPSSDAESDREDEIESDDKSNDDYEAVKNAKVVLEMDEDSITWADALDEEEEGVERVDISLGEVEMEFIFQIENVTFRGHKEGVPRM
ncbi:uncharacterized protein FSUBG_13833 [Fusarium subglutinans]|uniref:Uncharacterized protein n=1 Tax=Gibberella subglutinans TaxID=42677 RepID=A0A8H5NWI0_GIBSU|nr:uncharacterized protein FSUBG_13833 [Fusarium subglutinans]KAF5578275.1 hypothetical protein FSUBG_13833 [Fusarium subglutinans]